MSRALRVIKVGGRPQGDPQLASLLAADLASNPGRTIVVHGGGDEVSALQQTLGVTPRFVDGRRVTTPADMDVVRMALSGLANKRLVAALVTAGISAVGLSGEDASLIVARPVDSDRLGCVGTPTCIHVPLLRLLIDGGYVPVVSPVSCGSAGAGVLNVNADDVAAAVAVAVGAEELLLITDVPGVLREGAWLTDVSVDTAESLLDSGVATGGMHAKLQAAVVALRGGVARVRIADLAAIGDPQRGTVLTAAGVLV